MRSTCWLLGLGLAVFACTSDTTRVIYMDLSYQVRCLDCTPAAPDESAHKIKAVEGEGGLDLTCRAQRDGDTRLINFNSTYPGSSDTDGDNTGRYVLRVERADLDGDSNEFCQVHLEESGNTYEGRCGRGEPTEDQPCRVNLSVEGGVVKGDVYCSRITNINTARDIRYLVAPMTRAEPATFQVYGCTNL